ncbi:cytochrome c oxidase assembly protein [Hoeflea sp. CAU 1731]
MDGSSEKLKANAKRNNAILLSCVGVVVGMIGLSYAAVPLYQLFCQVTGYGGTIQRAEQYSNRILDRTIKVRFDSNISSGLDWEFKPVEREVEVRIGETRQISYLARNKSNRATGGQALFNVTPQAAGVYFNKVECFCFTETELQPGETLDMPVVFYVDPAIVDAPETKHITTLTLSYTMYPMEDQAKPVAEVRQINKEEAGRL